MVINCETVISNSSSHVWNERKLKWNFCRKSKSKHDTIKNKNSSFLKRKLRLLNDRKIRRKQSQFFFPFVYAERKFYEFFTVVHLTRVSSAMAWPLWEISTLETSLQFYFLALETYILIDQCISVFVASSAKIAGIQVRSESVNFRLFPVKFLDPWTKQLLLRVIDGTRACLDRAAFNEEICAYRERWKFG